MNRLRPDTKRAALSLPLLSVLAAAPGCGEDRVLVEAPGASAPSDGADGEPVYVVFSTIDTPDGRTGYFVTTPSIEGDVEVDVARGFEVPGGGQMYAPIGAGYVLVGDGEMAAFTRYELNDAGELERGPTISFANLGVADVWRHMILIGSSI